MAVWIKLISDNAIYFYLFCAFGFLLFFRQLLVARQERNQALFVLEREIATSKIGRSLAWMMFFLVLTGGMYGVQHYVAPQVAVFLPAESSPVVGVQLSPTPSREIGTPTKTSSPTVPPLSTIPIISLTPVLRTPTPKPATSPAPTSPPLPPGVEACPGSVAKITSPAPGAQLNGNVQIFGNTVVPDFNFYKVEIAPQGSGNFTSISDVKRQQVAGGLMDVWNTNAVPAGAYSLRLTVVDVTGNYPPKNICVISVTVMH
ncbi:MAG: hypothetical protein EXR62_07045 [Chloroflexi bacterium]|nr:hypothetical protein [Chloroflexota bacterium]